MCVRPLSSSSSRLDGMYGVWRSLELLFLLAYAAVFYFLLTRTSLQLASEYASQSNNGRLWGLRKERFFIHLNDVSDSQWRNFRDNLPILALVMAVFVIAANLVRSYFKLHGKGMARLWLTFSFIYIFYLHEACIIFLLIISFGNYVIAKALAGRKPFPILLWLYNLLFLVSNRAFEGYSFSSFGSALGYLDKHRGMQRWHICFNFVMLRMVSFGLDYHWACISRKSAFDLEKHRGSCDICHIGTVCYLVRQEKTLSSSDYSPGNYLCYLFYPPLYIAGPIISFNAFISQLEVPQRVYSTAKIMLYGLRWIGCFIFMEIMTHYFYYNSLAISGVWQTLSPWEIFTVGYGVLNFMWLKFLLIWRFFRFWALVGGIEVIENMPRCINNCYDLEGFWKSWHASYNRWLVRYLYIPLGGSRWRFLNIWVVFTFVAIWHDLEWKLLSWAWVTCVLMLPEILGKSLMRTEIMWPLRESVIYRELCAFGGAFSITSLMTANLIGFVVGPGKMRWLLQTMIEQKNLPTTIGIFCSFYIGTKLMFHVQEFGRHREAFKQSD